jgi:hypothetical protein
MTAVYLPTTMFGDKKWIVQASEDGLYLESGCCGCATDMDAATAAKVRDAITAWLDGRRD